MPLRTMASDTFRQGVELLTDGNPTVRFGTVGLATLAAAIWESIGGVLAAIVLLFWMADMLSGVLRAIDRHGLENFSWPEFWGGFRKLAAAGVVVAMAIGAEVLALESGAPVAPISAAVYSMVAWGFFWSALQNVGHFYPDVAERVESMVRSTGGRKPPEARSDP